LCFCSQFSFTQESRLSTKKVPEKIKNHIQTTYPGATQIKYYHQVENDTLFIESDFKSGIDKYSLLFFPDRRLYEIEIIVEFKEFPTEIGTKITNELNTRFKKYKILECYEVNPNSNALYEINVRGSSKNGDGTYELFFDKQGNFMKIKEEIIKPITTTF
jgi:hypothetical protein